MTVDTEIAYRPTTSVIRPDRRESRSNQAIMSTAAAAATKSSPAQLAAQKQRRALESELAIIKTNISRLSGERSRIKQWKKGPPGWAKAHAISGEVYKRGGETVAWKNHTAALNRLHNDYNTKRSQLEAVKQKIQLLRAPPSAKQMAARLKKGDSRLADMQAKSKAALAARYKVDPKKSAKASAYSAEYRARTKGMTKEQKAAMAAKRKAERDAISVAKRKAAIAAKDITE